MKMFTLWKDLNVVEKWPDSLSVNGAGSLSFHVKRPFATWEVWSFVNIQYKLSFIVV